MFPERFLNAPFQVFECKGQTMTVAEYYKNYKNIRLDYPHLPTVTAKKAGSFPLELLQIAPNQRFCKTLNSAQAQKMIQVCKRTA
jgi:hypothetical protein